MRLIAERTPQLAILYERTFGQVVGSDNLPAYIAADAHLQLDVLSDEPQRRTVDYLSDDELIALARSASNASKFDRLWRGDYSAYPSHSEADAALCLILSFWTQANAARIDRLFRASGLFRTKWNERRGRGTYGEQTIARAIERTSDVYEPPVTFRDSLFESDTPLDALDLEHVSLEHF